MSKKKNGAMIGFIATPEEMKIIDKLQRKYYTLNKSEIIRLIIREYGAMVYGAGKNAQTN